MLLVFGLILSVGVIAIVLQAVKGNSPLELLAYLKVYSLILLPNAIFLAAASLALHVLLRSRYVAYAVAIGMCVGLYYLYTQGHNNLSYNPLLFQHWSYPELNDRSILRHRGYVLTLAALFVAVAHLAHPRRSLWRRAR